MQDLTPAAVLGALSRAQEEVEGATGLWPDVEPGVGLRATDAARRAFDEGVAQEIYVQRRVREADDIAARLYPAVADDDPFLGMDSMAATRGVAFNEVPVSQARQNEVRAPARSRAEAQASSDWNRARERTGANPDVTGTGLLTAARDSMSNYWSSFADEGQRERNFLKHATGRGMQALGTLAYGMPEVAVAASNSPMQATVGGFKSIGNFGPDLFNLAANGLKTSLDGLSLLAELGAGEGALEGFRASKAYNLNPLFGYENQAQAGGAVLAQLAVGTGLAKYGKYNIELNLSSAGTLHSNPIPLKLTAPEPKLGVGSTVAAKGAARSVDELSQAAAAADRGGLTAAGRALQKHGGREGSAFPAAKGNPLSVNQQGQHAVDDILTNPGSTTVTRNHARFGQVTEVRAPDGRGVRYGADGKFIGFLEPNK